MSAQPMIAHPTLVYDGSVSINEFLDNPIIKIWRELENFTNYSLSNRWGREKILAAEYTDKKTRKKEKKDICYVIWEAALKVKGTK